MIAATIYIQIHGTWIGDLIMAIFADNPKMHRFVKEANLNELISFRNTATYTLKYSFDSKSRREIKYWQRQVVEQIFVLIEQEPVQILMDHVLPSVDSEDFLWSNR